MAQSAGIETLHPGVYVSEQGGVPRVPGVGVATFGIIGATEKGPTDRALLITSVNQFAKFYGGTVASSYVEPSVRHFFREGGTRVFVARAVSANTNTATVILYDSAPTGLSTMDVSAVNGGAWGNDVQVTTQKASTTLTANAALAANTITVANVRNFRPGDHLIIGPNAGSKMAAGFVRSVDFTNSAILTTIITGDTGPWVIGNVVATSSTHRASSTTTSTLSNTGISVTVVDGSSFRVGQNVTFIHTAGTPWEAEHVILTGVNGNTLSFAAVTLVAPITSGAIAVSQEFDLKVYEDGSLVETHAYLSMSSTNLKDYLVTRLSGSSTESAYITVEDNNSATGIPLDVPRAVVLTPLAGGTNGDSIANGDLIGSSVSPKKGMYLFDAYEHDINFFAIPGIDKDGIVLADAYAKSKGTMTFIADAPSAMDTPEKVLDWRRNSLALNSSFTAVYYPWLYENDSSTNNTRTLFPPSGHVAGVWAATAMRRGIHYSPANVSLTGVVDTTYPGMNDGDQDLLNGDGINCIRFFPNEGYVIWGARTLTTIMDGRQYVAVRRLLNYVKESLLRGNRQYVFGPINTSLFSLVKVTNEEFLRSMWLRGQLYPGDDASRAFFVKCDEENNPTTETRQGRLNIEVGVNPPMPAEMIVIRAGIWDGGNTVEEEIARRF